MGSLNWWVCLLLVAFAAKNVGAIKCHQCHECADDDKLKTPEECKSVTIGDALDAVLKKVVKSGGEEMGKALKEAFDKLGYEPQSCFKIVAPAITIRGCGPRVESNNCYENNGIKTCACRTDGCNGVSTA